jgi:nucleotide-binding universal stress UspA family protein
VKIEGSNEPRDAAIEFADTNHLKTIVCGSRGLGAIQRLVFGSFSTHMMHNATQHAVLVVHQ